MKRKSILFLLLMVGICNALVAQKLEKHVAGGRDGGLLLVSHEYTTLPNGVMHGKHYEYDPYADGKSAKALKAYLEWDNGLLTKISCYQKGKLQSTYCIENGILCTNVMHKDRNGKPMIQYVLQNTPKTTYCYAGDSLNYLLKSYKDQVWTYTLLSNGTQADIKYEDHTHYTYDYKNEELTIHKTSEGVTMDHASVSVKNNVASYELLRDVEHVVGGYVYTLKKGTKGEMVIDKAFDKEQFGLHFFKWIAPNVDFEDLGLELGEDDDYGYPSLTRINYYSTPLYALVLMATPIELELTAEHVSKEYANMRTAMVVKYQDRKYKVKLVNGDWKNGECEGNDMKVTIVDGKITRFTCGNDDATVIASKYNEEGYFEVEMLEGTRIHQRGYYDKPWRYEGKFENGIFVEGKVIKGNRIEEGTFDSDGSIQTGVIKVLDSGKDNMVERSVEYYDGMEVSAKKVVTYTDGSIYSFSGEFIQKRQDQDFELEKGDIEITLAGGRDLEIYRLLASNIPLNLKSFRCTVPFNTVRMEKTNGDVFEGVIPDELLYSIIGEFIESKSSVQVIKGKYTTAQGNMLEGTFKKRDILYKGLDPRLHISGSADFATEFGRYIGGYAACKAEGDGKIIINDLGELTGTFAGDKISKDAVCTVDFKLPTGDTFKGQMLGGKAHGHCELRLANGDYYIGKFENGKFSGTGDVRYTHSKGVYEGKVKDFVCQYDTPQDKKALKKVKAPKMPKIALPSKVGKMM